MKIVIVNSYEINGWNGYMARFCNKGISGSHNALMYHAESLAALNNEVIMVSMKNNFIETKYKNVSYINYENFTDKSCEYIITCNNLFSLHIIDKIESYIKIIILTLNDLCIDPYLYNVPINKILIAYISNFAKVNILISQKFLEVFDSVVIPNSQDLNDVDDEVVVKKDYICYFACIERCFLMVKEILAKLDGYKLYTNTYSYNNMKNLTNETTIMTEGTGKYEIYSYVKRSKYFIYPLINLENNTIHYDTFGYVVFEALLHGTIVICPRIKIYEELYGSAIVYIDDDKIDNDDLLYWKKTNANFGLLLKDKYIEKVKMLDNNEMLREEYIKRGKEIGKIYCNNIIGNKFNILLKEVYNNHVRNHLLKISEEDLLPKDHVNYLKQMKDSGFEPKIIYDIGSCVLHWSKEAKKLWPNATIILFDAFQPAEFLYENYNYHIGVLSNEKNKTVKFYQNDMSPGGNSYYREIGSFFPPNKYKEYITDTLDNIVLNRNFPLPDLVKIDVQGSEIDIIKGGVNCLKNVKKIIVELRHKEYNEGAYLADESINIIESLLPLKCSSKLFCNNGPDGDYCFDHI